MVAFIVDDLRTFVLKVLTVAVGVVDVGFIGENYYPIFTEKPFLAVVCILFSLSLIHLVLQTCGVILESTGNKRIVIAYHCVAALLLYMTTSVFFFSVIGLAGECVGCTSHLVKRYLAAALGFINGFLYGCVAWNMMDIQIVSKNKNAPKAGNGAITVHT